MASVIKQRKKVKEIFENYGLGHLVSDTTPNVDNMGYMVYLLDTQKPQTKSYQKARQDVYEYVRNWLNDSSIDGDFEEAKRVQELLGDLEQLTGKPED